MEVSITRALAELKKINKRLDTINLESVGKVVKIRDKEEKEKVENEVLARVQSLEANLKRRAQIKAAIAIANVQTPVNFKNSTAKTIYELIIEKETLKAEEDKLYLMSKRAKDLETQRDEANKKLDGVIQSIIEKAYGGTKPSDTFVNDITKSHYATQEAIIALYYTPDEIRAKLVEYENHITEIDIYLSEINSKTMINIPD